MAQALWSEANYGEEWLNHELEFPDYAALRAGYSRVRTGLERISAQ